MKPPLNNETKALSSCEDIKADVKYHNGFMLVISKSGHAPALFLEWMAGMNRKNHVHTRVLDDADADLFKIRIDVRGLSLRAVHEDAALYINNNLQ